MKGSFSANVQRMGCSVAMADQDMVVRNRQGGISIIMKRSMNGVFGMTAWIGMVDRAYSHSEEGRLFKYPSRYMKVPLQMISW